MRQVTIVQRTLPHYRVAFFALLRERLQQKSVDLRVIYGQEFPGTTPQSVFVDAPWASRVRNRYLLQGRAVWQPCRGLLEASDLVILEHANAILFNQWLLLRRRMGGRRRLAFWGHGRNLQGTTGFGEALKKWTATQVDWWFAYTSLSASAVAAGFPRERITVVDNAIDTAALSGALQAVTPAEQNALRERLGLKGASVCVYCGGMYGNKKLDFLIEACVRIRERLPDFEMIFVGHGPEQCKVEKAADKHRWIRYVGPKHGAEVAGYWKIGKLLLVPGSVGLAIVDSFVASVPIVTIDVSLHGPEIAYLSNGVNGAMTRHDAGEYATAVVELLGDEEKMRVLQSGCAQSARRYTIDNMVSNYADGIMSCLNLTDDTQ